MAELDTSHFLDDGTEPAEDLLPEVITFPQRVHKVLQADGTQKDLKLPRIPEPAPVFHDTKDENHIDDDLSIATPVLRTTIRLLDAAKTVPEMLSVIDRIWGGMEKRRKLANKRIGAEAQMPKGTLYHIPD